jgi:hypothetical protein
LPKNLSSKIVKIIICIFWKSVVECLQEEFLSEAEITYSQSEQVNELVAALAKAKLKYGEVVKSKENKYTGSLYADLQDLMNAAERPLAEEGLVIVHFPLERIEQKKAGALTKLIHASGQFFGNQFLMPATGKATGGAEKLDAQTITGGVTYAKRCNYGALAGLVGEADDDGNALADKSGEVATAPKPKPVQKPAPVNQARANQGGERPNDSKPSVKITNVPALPVEPVTITIPAAPANDPKFDDVVPVQAAFPLPEAVFSPDPPFQIEPKPVESTTSAPNTLKSSEKPSKSQFDAYTKRATELRIKLEKAGLKPSKNLTVGGKLKEYVLKVAGAKDLTEMAIYQWEDFFIQFEQEDPAKLVALIDGGKA